MLEREWWLIKHLRFGYQDVDNMPLEYLEWFYQREIKEITDQQQGNSTKVKG